MGMPKVFISHAYKDRLLVDAFVNLLTKAGIPEEQIVCSSTAGTQLHTGNSLYAELRKELTNDNVFVIFMLSENFYTSPVCLNEMGAAWIRDAKCHVILLPEFTFGQMKGVICEKGLIGISLDSYDRPAVERFNHLRCDLATFGFILSFEKWDLAILDFYRAIDAYKKKFKDGIVIDMADVRSYCIDDADNDGCRVIKKESSKDKTTAVVDFEKTTSKLCSIVYRIEQKDWLSLDKKGTSLCFDAYADVENLRAEVELHMADRNEQIPITLTDDTTSFRIPLSHFTSSLGAWKEVKEVCVLFRKKYIGEKVKIVIEKLHLDIS